MEVAMTDLSMWLAVVFGLLTLVMAGVVAVKWWRRLRAPAQSTAVDVQPARSDKADAGDNSLVQALAAQLPLSESTLNEIRKELRQAGYYRPSALAEFNATRFVLMVLLLFGFAALAVILPERLTASVLILGGLTALLGYSVPRVIVQMQARDRIRRIVRGMPDAVDLINLGVSRGLTLAAALERVQPQLKAIHPELSQELEVVRRQANMLSLEHALRQMAERLDSPEIRSFADTLSHAERLGTGVSGALSTYAASLRTAARQEAEQALSSAPFKMLFPIATCLVPAVIIILLGPAVVELNTFVRQHRQILSAQRIIQPRFTVPEQ